MIIPAMFKADGYKYGHPRQYPEGTETVFANFTARKSRQGLTHLVYAGGQLVCMEVLINGFNETFFSRPKAEVVAEFKDFMDAYMGPNSVDINHIEELHDLGYLPVKIMSLPEGTVHPVRVPCFVIWNTAAKFYWVTNFLETVLSTYLWGMCTSATTAREYNKLLTRYAMKTVGNADFVKFQAHDFSFRGMFGEEAAALSGMGHLMSFAGTDTPPAIIAAKKYYNADTNSFWEGLGGTGQLIGCTIPATEHSVMCAGGKLNELDTFLYLFKRYPTGPLAVVSDTWDFWAVVKPGGLLSQIKEQIMARDGKLVIRPDSGDPIKIVCGEAYPIAEVTIPHLREAIAAGYKHVKHKGRYYEITTGTQGLSVKDVEKTPVLMGAMECLAETFGTTLTEKGYQLLDSHIGLVYGDSITLERAEEIVRRLEVMGFASINIVFGIGSYTYAYVTRDTLGFAIKATWVMVNGVAREISKDPATDDGTKKSAEGLIAVFKDEHGELFMKDHATWEEVLNCEFIPIFEDGKMQTVASLGEIRERLLIH